jgi:hypothetical protein
MLYPDYITVKNYLIHSEMMVANDYLELFKEGGSGVQRKVLGH